MVTQDGSAPFYLLHGFDCGTIPLDVLPVMETQMIWNWKTLIEDVERLYGRPQVQELHPCLQSIGRRQSHAQFHYQEAKRLIAEQIGERDDQAIAVDFIFMAGTEEYNEFHSQRRKAEAHIVACMQGMHAVGDILGHVLYFALGLNVRSPLKPREVSINRVRGMLPMGDIATKLDELTSHPDYIYISDVVNRSKHRNVIDVPYSVDMTGQDSQPHGLKFSAFQHGGKEGNARNHPSRWVNETLTKEYPRQSKTIVDIGLLLNQTLRGQ